MPQKKNQHYVPQFYLKNFSDDGKMIGVYILKDRKYIPKAPIKNQASKDYMYSKDPTMENALGDIEGLADGVVKKLIENPKSKLEESDSEFLYVFTMLQIGRTLNRINEFQELTDLMVKQNFMATRQLKKEHGLKDEYSSISKKLLNTVKFGIQEPGIISVGTSAKLISLCRDLKLKILINKTEADLVTSDNPACMYDQFLERIGDNSIALGLRGIQIYLPLTPRLAIMYYDSDVYKMGSSHKSYVYITNRNDIFELNKLVAANSNSALFCKDSTKNISKYEIYANLYDYVSQIPTFDKINIRDHNGGIIIGSHTRGKFFHLKLSFVKEMSRYAYIERKDFDVRDRYRPITYIKDQIIKEQERVSSKKNRRRCTNNLE